MCIRYRREAFLAAFEGPAADAWPLFDALAGLPVALIRGANTDLLSVETAKEMRRRRPDMIYAEVPGRAHVPFLDEPENLAAVAAFLGAVALSLIHILVCILATTASVAISISHRRSVAPAAR